MRMNLVWEHPGWVNKLPHTRNYRKVNALSDWVKRPDHSIAKDLLIKTGIPMHMDIIQALIHCIAPLLSTSEFIIVLRMEFSLTTHIKHFSISVHQTIASPVFLLTVEK